MSTQQRNQTSGDTVVSAKTPQKNNQSGRQVNLPINAGQVVRINSAGNQFYLVVATAPVNIRPDGGDFSLYQQGTGSQSRLSDFKILEIQNPNSVPVVISCWVGFDAFIDNRLIIANTLTPSVVKPTQTAPTAVPLTGQQAFAQGVANGSIPSNATFVSYNQTNGVVSYIKPTTNISVAPATATTATYPASYSQDQWESDIANGKIPQGSTFVSYDSKTGIVKYNLPNSNAPSPAQ